MATKYGKGKEGQLQYPNIENDHFCKQTFQLVAKLVLG
jgi:hypothetical protein